MKSLKRTCGGLKAPRVFKFLLIGCYTVPTFEAQADFEEFVKSFEQMPREEREKILKKSVCVTPLKEEEYMNVLCFCKDKNGIPYSKENVENLTYDEIMELVVKVCLAYSDCKVFF